MPSLCCAHDNNSARNEKPIQPFALLFKRGEHHKKVQYHVPHLSDIPATRGPKNEKIHTLESCVVCSMS
jgi:hypothetical protein